MDGLKVSGVVLFLCEVPNRKGLAFCFQEGTTFYPVAYVSKKHEAKARDYWQKMMNNLGVA
jgi:hypothetical protein